MRHWSLISISSTIAAILVAASFVWAHLAKFLNKCAPEALFVRFTCTEGNMSSSPGAFPVAVCVRLMLTPPAAVARPGPPIPNILREGISESQVKSLVEQYTPLVNQGLGEATS